MGGATALPDDVRAGAPHSVPGWTAMEGDAALETIDRQAVEYTGDPFPCGPASSS